MLFKFLFQVLFNFFFKCYLSFFYERYLIFFSSVILCVFQVWPQILEPAVVRQSWQGEVNEWLGQVRHPNHLHRKFLDENDLNKSFQFLYLNYSIYLYDHLICLHFNLCAWSNKLTIQYNHEFLWLCLSSPKKELFVILFWTKKKSYWKHWKSTNAFLNCDVCYFLPLFCSKVL